ncbi:MAG: DUF1440 domain-containing protein [Bacteroidetes bacterium]|nr:DUF1440 domain-containing protein [Bacteroidota bacterium]
MKSPIQNTIFAGIAGTIVMTIIMFLAPLMGFPKMNAAEMLSSMMDFPILVGWTMHFMIGIVFALSYSFIFLRVVKIENVIAKGALFGFGVFIFAQIMMAVMGAIVGSMPPPEGGMALLILGSMIGHIMYGIPVAIVVQSQLA